MADRQQLEGGSNHQRPNGRCRKTGVAVREPRLELDQDQNTHKLAMRSRGQTLARVRHAEACAAQIYGVRHEDMRASTRGPAIVAWARQVAMYQCHTTLRLSLTDVGVLFERDRTTVGHACRIVEDRRDDETFDVTMTCLERTILAGADNADLQADVGPMSPAHDQDTVEIG